MILVDAHGASGPAIVLITVLLPERVHPVLPPVKKVKPDGIVSITLIVVAGSVPWLKTVMVKVTVDHELKGVDEPLVKSFLKARSNDWMIPVAVPVLITISLSQAPQLIQAVLEKVVHPVPVTLKETKIVPLVPPVSGLKNHTISLEEGS